MKYTLKFNDISSDMRYLNIVYIALKTRGREKKTASTIVTQWQEKFKQPIYTYAYIFI